MLWESLQARKREERVSVSLARATWCLEGLSSSERSRRIVRMRVPGSADSQILKRSSDGRLEKLVNAIFRK